MPHDEEGPSPTEVFALFLEPLLVVRSKPKLHKHKVLWVEGRWKSNPVFVPSLIQKGFIVKRVASGKEAMDRLARKQHDVVIIDAASMRTSAERICKSLRETSPSIPIIVISDPKWEISKDVDCANVILTLPFTQRKLLNRLKPLLPSESGDIIKAGPIQLDMSAKYVKANGRRTQLTPRLMRLLKMLIDHRGEMVERNKLFSTVWNTNYTGDTRTLDVHISWLRQAIEKDPKSPKLLKTMRGVGYILDI